MLWIIPGFSSFYSFYSYLFHRNIVPYLSFYVSRFSFLYSHPLRGIVFGHVQYIFAWITSQSQPSHPKAAKRNPSTTPLYEDSLHGGKHAVRDPIAEISSQVPCGMWQLQEETYKSKSSLGLVQHPHITWALPPVPLPQNEPDRDEKEQEVQTSEASSLAALLGSPADMDNRGRKPL